jgi:HYDIN/CFA65/VesB family protein
VAPFPIRRWKLIAVLSAVIVALATAGAAAADPDLELEPGAGVDFGEVQLGLATEAPVTLTNGGTTAAAIDEVALLGDPGFDVTADDCPSDLTLEVNQSCELTIAFAPSAAGAHAATLLVASDASDSPDLLPLSGTGVFPPAQLVVDPPALDFGTVSSAEKTISLTNIAGFPIVVTASIEGPHASAFALSSDAGVEGCLAQPLVMACTVGVRFTSLGPGLHGAELVLAANGLEYDIPLAGTGPAATRAPPVRPPVTKSTRPVRTRPVLVPGAAPQGQVPVSTIKQALSAALEKRSLRWIRAGKRGIRKADAFALSTRALGWSGTLRLEVRTTAAPRRLLASGALADPQVKAKVLTARLTRAGKALLRAPGKRRLRARLAFTPAGGATITIRHSFTLRD